MADDDRDDDYTDDDIDTGADDVTDADDADVDDDAHPGGGDNDDDGADDDGDDGDGGDEPKVYDEKYVKNLRRENAKTRRDARAAAAKAADEAAERARDEFARDLFGALGLGDDEDDVDAEELVRLANEREANSAQRLREYQVKDAVTGAARTAAADLDMLIPHLKGRDLLRDLNPDDDDFSEQVAEIVEAEVAKYPKLKADSPIARRSGADMSAGTGEPKKKKPRTIDDIRKARREHREKKYGASV